MPSLVRELVKPNQDVIFKIEPLQENALQFSSDGHLASVAVSMLGQTVTVKAQQFIFTAGAGNELVTRKIPAANMQTQRRPLHMVLVKTPFNLPLYGGSVWYLGGLLAEEGVKRNRSEQITAARQELQSLFPWLDFSAASFSTFMIDRAEPKQKGGLKPESVFSQTAGNVTVAWPTKLALAPKLAADILRQLQHATISSRWHDVHELRAWPMPPLATPIWEDAFCKSVA